LRSVVNVGMNLRVSQNSGSFFFLAICGTVSLSLTIITAGVTWRGSRYLSQNLDSEPPIANYCFSIPFMVSQNTVVVTGCPGE